MKREAYNHPKMLDLAARLGVTRTHARGIISTLWNWAADFAPEGNVGKWTDGTIAEACDHKGDATAFVEALVASRWLDACAVHRLVIHDLEEHAPDWWKTRNKRLKKGFLKATPIVQGAEVTGASERANGTCEHSREPTREQSDPQGASALLCSALETSALKTSSPPTPPAPEVEPKRERKKRDNPQYAFGMLPIPDSLCTPEFTAAWERWVMYRHRKRKPITLIAAEEQIAALARAGPEVAIQAISEAIRNDYQGLFPERVHQNGNRNGKQPSAGQQYRPGTDLGAV